MPDLALNLQSLQNALAACATEGRAPALLAVSKTQSAQRVAECAALGQRAFGENYVQEAVAKITALAAQELEWHLLASLILLGICHALQRGDNVRVDVFYASYKPRTKYVVDLVSLVLLLAVSLIFIKLSIPYVMQSYGIGERSPDPGGLTHRWVIKALIPLGYVLVSIQCGAAIARRMLIERQRTAA